MADLHRSLVASILNLLAWTGIEASETDASRVWNARGSVRASKVRTGWPDITLVLPPHGIAAFMEVKVGRDRLRPDQAQCIQNLSRAGARVAVVRSLDDAATNLKNWLPQGDVLTRLEKLIPTNHNNTSKEKR